MKKITSIEIINRSRGPYSVYEIIAEGLRIYGTGEIKHLQFNGLSDEPINEYEYKVDEMDAFFDKLINKIKIQEWIEDYSIEVCDGWTWECKIHQSDQSIKKVIGTVEPPPKGNQLKNLIYKLVVFETEPWIF
jgi:hypothetical protein